MVRKPNYMTPWSSLLVCLTLTAGVNAQCSCDSHCDALYDDASTTSCCVCETAGCESCGCANAASIFDGLLGGLIKPSDSCFDDFISPMTNPVFFEDPRTLTEARAIFINHKIPPVLPGLRTDSVQLFAMQLRAALTDRLSIIATKDGYIVSDSPLLDDGWADVAAGLKYNLIRNPKEKLLVSGGVTFELPIGSTRALQGNGDGEFHLFLTGMKQIGCWHWISGSGFRLPTNTAEESQVWYWSNHWDRKITDKLYFLTEVNWYHWMQAGRSFPLPIEGGDLFNLGSVGVAGNDIVTAAVGAKYKPNDGLELGVAFEFPATDRRDLLDNRLTFDCIFRY